ETLAWIGTLLFTINIWQVKDPECPPPPDDINQCLLPQDRGDSRPPKVDLFIATYSEDVELVRLSIQDALKMTYPAEIVYRVHVLDDVTRHDMRAVYEEEVVIYIIRHNNIGYNARNTRNRMELTDGGLLIICDADTRVFASLLTHTLGYFRDPYVAWVQTPQW